MEMESLELIHDSRKFWILLVWLFCAGSSMRDMWLMPIKIRIFVICLSVA